MTSWGDWKLVKCKFCGRKIRFGMSRRGRPVAVEPDRVFTFVIPDTMRTDWREPRFDTQAPAYVAHQPFCELARRLKGAA